MFSFFITLQLLLQPAFCDYGRGTPDPNLILAQFDILTDGDMLILPVRLRDKTYSFCLDTGCGQNVFDSSIPGIRKYRLQDMTVETPTGKSIIHQYREPGAMLGSLELKTNEPVWITDLHKIREVSGHDIYGMIGLSFLKRHVVAVSFDCGKLYFLKAPVTPHGIAVPMVYDCHGASIDASVPELGKHRFVVDTGFDESGGIRKSAYDLLLTLRHLRPVGEVLYGDYSGDGKAIISTLDSLSVGPFVHKGLIFSNTANSYLGMKYLSRFNVIFDFPQARLYLAKSKYYDSPDGRNLSGLHLLQINGSIVVDSVDTNSPGDASGIKPRDVIVRVGELQAGRARLYSLRLCLQTPCPDLRITVRRDQEEITTKILLSNH